jgi:RAD51-like protein 2
MTAISALDALLDQEQSKQITTSSTQIDRLLGGGISIGSVTEICGMAGLGKTQLSMQLAANVQLSVDKGGLESHCIYIDTEGSFIPKRMQQIASNTGLPWQKVLSNIQIFRAHSLVELLACINQLEHRLENVKLIVIDSIAFHFRSITNYQERTRILNTIAQTLRRIATIHQIAIVIVNQMTTKISDSRVVGSVMVPALGESWGHACTHRMILLWKGGERVAWLCKSSTLEEGFGTFDITSSGIC